MAIISQFQNRKNELIAALRGGLCTDYLRDCLCSPPDHCASASGRSVNITGTNGRIYISMTGGDAAGDEPLIDLGGVGRH